MSQKKLYERIAERTKQQEAGRKQQYKAIFLSLLSDIEEASQAGWRVRTIWETLHYEKKFEGTYECFLSYFNKFIKRKTEGIPPSNAVSPNFAESNSDEAKFGASSVPAQEFSKNFTHNPVAPDLKTFV